ncbi:MAG: hypothetical protein OXF11_19680 [Deltaproteobacteria bacterium]|nr:hypothetical protein [Deltaproteobacteria bacterium]
MTKWRIKGYDSTTELISGVLVSDDDEVQRLLRELAATGLTPQEVLEEYTGGSGRLHVEWTAGGYMTTGNPHFTARQVAD